MAGYDSDNPRMRERVIVELWRWVETHPAADDVVIAAMTMTYEPEKRSAEALMFTPRDFVAQVMERTAYGQSFLAFLVRQANEYRIPPEEFIRRAVTANSETR